MKTIQEHLFEQRGKCEKAHSVEKPSMKVNPKDTNKGDVTNSTHGGESSTYEHDGVSVKTVAFNSESDANNFMSGKKGAYGLVGKIGEKYHVAKRNTSNSAKDKQSPKNAVKEDLEVDTFEEMFFEDASKYEEKSLKDKLIEQRTGKAIAWNKVTSTHGGETRSVYQDGGRVYQTYVFNTESQANNFLKSNKGYGIIGRNGYQVHVARRSAKGRPTDKQTPDGRMAKGLS